MAKFYDTVTDCLVEVVKHDGKPALAVQIVGPFHFEMIMPLEDAETLGDMLIAAVRAAEAVDDEKTG